ncbi:hypothetical protein KKA93_00940 [Patescibacteria group bacterium]|nr:hypothetical protein [Patescibacteria group bacterium]MBU1663489.1 hypothetical protein [Patescibacteria group bacterium]MBU1933734.1 hypothetical protein [Patescibacteria group bacterium]MBU2007598.1 hypothetical protein [Patescibacteria group bacterium]MBU2233588.1 hypothetical protein [Patescibacteria group bacterium]
MNLSIDKIYNPGSNPFPKTTEKEKMAVEKLENSEELDDKENIAGMEEVKCVEAVREVCKTESSVDSEILKKMQKRFEGISDPEAQEKLAKVFSQILGCGHAIEEEKHEAIQKIVQESNIPAHLLQKAMDATGIENQEKLSEHLFEKHGEKEKELENFIKKAKQPFNFLYIDQSIPKEEIQKRMDVLEILYKEFDNASMSDKNKMEELMIKMFGVPTIPNDVEKYLNELQEDEAVVQSEGAENKNSIFLGSELRPQIIKTTKGRHDVDFTSVLKLMRNMHVLLLRMNHEPIDNIDIDFAFKDMTIYKDGEENYKRMVRQDYAPGQTIKELPDEIKKEDPEFRKAWQSFLKKVQSTEQTDGIVLDITDSSAGFKKERGNVLNTGNVFVKFPTEPGEKYKFSIIDPDVFDTKPGEHKFDPTEHIRKKGFRGIIPAIKTAATNQARERVVRKWQEEFTEKELKY